ncbi:MAG: flagellar hook-basal body complex protein FliE [Planctomycetaceae bacterium]
MSISPIGGVPGASGVGPTSSVPNIVKAPRSEASGASFAKLLGEMVNEASAQHQQADTSVKQLMSGETDNLHEVVLDAARADMSFRLLVEIRNKLMDAYQEIMRMQV